MEGYSLFFFGFTTKAAAQQQQQLGESEGTKASYGTEYRIEVSRKQNKNKQQQGRVAYGSLGARRRVALRVQCVVWPGIER